jgi:hypothetical protein
MVVDRRTYAEVMWWRYPRKVEDVVDDAAVDTDVLEEVAIESPEVDDIVVEDV